MSYSDNVAAHIRLSLLRLLGEAPEYRWNSSVLADGIASLGLPTTRDQVRGQLAWLEEQGLVTTTEPAPGLIVATATERGLDVAAGRARVPGVQRPAPSR